MRAVIDTNQGFADYVITVDKDLLYRSAARYLNEWGIGVISGDDLVKLLDTQVE